MTSQMFDSYDVGNIDFATILKMWYEIIITKVFTTSLTNDLLQKNMSLSPLLSCSKLINTFRALKKVFTSFCVSISVR